MQTYISFLRSVNIAGHNLIKMTELAALFIDMGYVDAKTYIQSGNIIFTYSGKSSASIISGDIEKAILKKFNLTISVITRKPGDLSKLLAANPFLNDPVFDQARMAVIFLQDAPMDSQVQKVAGVDFPPDKFKIIGDDIFIYCPNGFGRTKLYTGFFETKMN